MREILNVESKSSINPYKLPPETIMEIGEFLDSKTNLHIEVVYFTANGDYYFQVHSFPGKDKKYKGKLYARFEYKNVEIVGNGGVSQVKRLAVPIEDYEIVKEYDAETLVKEYIKLKNK